MQTEYVVRRLAEIYAHVDSTTRNLAIVASLVSKTPAGPRRLALVNLLFGANDQRERQMEEARQLLSIARARVESKFGPERAAAHFSTMEARQEATRAIHGSWREMVAALLADTPVSAA